MKNIVKVENSELFVSIKDIAEFSDYKVNMARDLTKRKKNANKPKGDKSRGFKDRNFRGIYILYENGNIVYVGKSETSTKRRISIHKRSKLLFTHYKEIRFESVADLNLAEIYYISLFSPSENKDCKTKDILNIRINQYDKRIVDAKLKKI